MLVEIYDENETVMYENTSNYDDSFVVVEVCSFFIVALYWCLFPVHGLSSVQLLSYTWLITHILYWVPAAYLLSGKIRKHHWLSRQWPAWSLKIGLGSCQVDQNYWDYYCCRLLYSLWNHLLSEEETGQERGRSRNRNQRRWRGGIITNIRLTQKRNQNFPARNLPTAHVKRSRAVDFLTLGIHSTTCIRVGNLKNKLIHS